MKNTVYDVPSDIVTGTSQFKLTFNETGQITTLWNPGDPDAMNWIHGRLDPREESIWLNRVR